MTAPKPARHVLHRSFEDAVAALLLWAIAPWLEAYRAVLWLRANLVPLFEAAAWKLLTPPADPVVDQLDADTARRFREVSGQFRQLGSREVSR